MAGYVREYTLGPLIGTTIDIYRNNFSKFAVVCLIPFVVLHLAIGQIWGVEIWDPVPAGAAVPDGYMPSFLIFTIVSLIVSAAVIVTIAAIIEDKDVDAGQALGRALGAFLKLIVFYLLNAVAVTIGLVLLVIPGIIASLRLVFGWPAILVEDAGPIEAFGRSWSLSQNNMWRLLGILLAMGMAMTVIIAIAIFLFVLIMPADSVTAISLFSGLLYGLFLPLFTIPWVLLYYDLRVRKGEFGGPLEVRAS